MADVFEIRDLENLSAGAIGEPGERTFLIQATSPHQRITVLVEKEQVALLAREAVSFLDRLEHDEPGTAPALDVVDTHGGEVVWEEPLFRARVVGLGYDPVNQKIMIELREREDELPDEHDDFELGYAPGATEPRVARFFASPAQVRMMAVGGARAVKSGRPRCSLCGFPMDPDGHRCPRWN